MNRLALCSMVILLLAACKDSETSDGEGGAGTGASGTGASGTGASGTGASGTGGDGAGSTGGEGTGGSGAGSANDRCSDFCDDFVAAGCSNGPTAAGCQLTCETLTSSSTCDPQGNDYFDCVESGTVECTQAGDPFVQGCGIDWLEAIGCAVTTNPNPDIVAPCDTYCDSIVAASCPNNGTKDDCNAVCLWAGATGHGCDGEWETFLTCANQANFICVFGYAAAQGCGPEFTAYSDCINGV